MLIRKNAILKIVLLSAISLQVGCKFTPKVNTIEEINHSLDDAIEKSLPIIERKDVPQISDLIKDDLVNEISNDFLGKVSVKDRYIDIDANNIDAKVFFLSLVQGSPYNMSVHPDLRGNVSLSAKNISLRNALEQVAKLYDFVWEEIPGGFQVSPAQLNTVIYPLDYLYITRTGSSSLSIGGSSSSSGSSGSSSSGSSGSSSSSSGSSTGSGSGTVSTTSTQDLWTEIKTTITALIGTEPGKSVTLSPQTGLVMVTAMPKDLRKVNEYIKYAQKSVNKQVIIEAKILEVKLTDTSYYGINWSAPSLNNLGLTLIQSAMNGSNYGAAAGALSLTSDAALARVPGSSINPFASVISALSAQGTVQVLSSPRVSAMNNQKAIIKVGKTSYYIVGSASSIAVAPAAGAAAGAATTIANSGPPVSQFFDGISLDVTPYIDQNNMITLHVHPTITNITQDPMLTNYPSIDARESDSIVRARDNQIIVIGGLMSTKVSQTHTGTGLKNTANNKEKIELVILLRPRIVTDESIVDDMNASKGRFNGLIQGIEKGK